ncbi:hypothetical protein PHYPSEUDO_001347 [Phytophthora pseudosyringae]|uniref:Uncharacterized protein n=1 Tax=Phytophthora pseudosyringae TaxID=221518 RepID=A0A8T1WJY7_9STRA|nr:hypothetical protein PHYPSEUDO_001347 [Phytophthora pseudosyringae]
MPNITCVRMFRVTVDYETYSIEQDGMPEGIQAAYQTAIQTRWDFMDLGDIGIAFLRDPLTHFLFGPENEDGNGELNSQACDFAEMTGMLDDLGATRAKLNTQLCAFASGKRG